MLLGIVRNWFRKERGTTAIEFSLLAVPYMLTVICIIEMGVYFASTSMLEGATVDAARLIKTGQLQQTGGDPLQEFEDKLCDGVDLLIDCGDIQFHVIKLDEFSNVEPEIDDEGNLDPPTIFEIDQINSGCVFMVRVINRFQFMTPFFGNLFANYPGSRKLQISTLVLQTEPYEFEADAC